MEPGLDPSTPRCSRCRRPVHPGRGDYYVVRIEAVADPAPPVFTADDLAIDFESEFERLVAATRDLTAQQAMDQVHRRVDLLLCLSCYGRWIEDPAGARVSE
jgi:hypothetical protein